MSIRREHVLQTGEFCVSDAAGNRYTVREFTTYESSANLAGETYLVIRGKHLEEAGGRPVNAVSPGQFDIYPLVYGDSIVRAEAVDS